MLQAMNTGHDGSMTTIHANNPRDAMARLEVMIAMAGYEIPVRALRSQVASAINVIVQAPRRLTGGKRERWLPSARSPAWKGIRSRCTICSFSSSRASTPKGLPRANSWPAASARRCWSASKIARLALPPDMFQQGVFLETLRD